MNRDYIKHLIVVALTKRVEFISVSNEDKEMLAELIMTDWIDRCRLSYRHIYISILMIEKYHKENLISANIPIYLLDEGVRKKVKAINSVVSSGFPTPYREQAINIGEAFRASLDQNEIDRMFQREKKWQKH